MPLECVDDNLPCINDYTAGPGNLQCCAGTLPGNVKARRGNGRMANGRIKWWMRWIDLIAKSNSGINASLKFKLSPFDFE
jgi:hypothetical protein